MNLRTGPDTSYEILMVIEKDTEMTRIETGNGWDRVRLKNGMVGYMSSSYLTKVPDAQIERIELKMEKTTLNKGEQGKIDVSIYPFEACNRPIIYLSSNPIVATVDNTGKVQALHSGKTTITVKAVDSNVASQIELTVVTKVEKVEILPKDVYLQIGETVNLQVSVLPGDADNQEVVFSSENEEIASVVENGSVLAKQEGKTKMRASSKENPDVYAETNVYVVRQMQEDEITFAKPLVVKELQITGLVPKANTVAELKAKITTLLELEFVNYKNEVLQDNELIGTGGKIRVKEDGAILREYTIVLYGDADGNGKIDSVDLLVIQRDILEIERMASIFAKASNISKNGKKPTALDLLFIQRHILEIEQIKQT